MKIGGPKNPAPGVKVTRAAAKEQAVAAAAGKDYNKSYKIKIKGNDASMRASGTYDKIKIKQVTNKKYDKLYAKGPGKNAENQSKTGLVVRRDLNKAGIGGVATKRVGASKVLNQKSNLNIRGKVKKALGIAPRMNADEKATRGHQTYVAKQDKAKPFKESSSSIARIKTDIPPKTSVVQNKVEEKPAAPESVVTKRKETSVSFDSEFAKARKSGKKTFVYNGKSYNTNLSNDKNQSGSVKARMGTNDTYYKTVDGKEVKISKEEFEKIK